MNRYRTVLTIVLLGVVFCSFSGCTSGKRSADKPPEPQEPQYRTGTVLLIESDGYGYLARVTEDTPLAATEVPVHFFSEEIRKKAGDTVASDNILKTREKPPNGWASRPVAVEYFDGVTWKHEMDVLEMEDSYLLPARVKEERRVEFANVRIPIVVSFK